MNLPSRSEGNVRVHVTDMGASSNRTCATCPTVATGDARPLLLGHHSSNGTAVMSNLSVATEGYGPLLQSRTVVVEHSEGSKYLDGLSLLVNACQSFSSGLAKCVQITTSLVICTLLTPPIPIETIRSRQIFVLFWSTPYWLPIHPSS
jgi:hypothetical protein